MVAYTTMPVDRLKQWRNKGVKGWASEAGIHVPWCSLFLVKMMNDFLPKYGHVDKENYEHALIVILIDVGCFFYLCILTD